MWVLGGDGGLSFDVVMSVERGGIMRREEHYAVRNA